MTQLRHEIFVCSENISVYYTPLFWRFKDNNRENKPSTANFLGDFVDFASKIANFFWALTPEPLPQFWNRWLR